MNPPNSIDGVLVQWGDRLFYPSNRQVRAGTPRLTGAALHRRAQNVRHHIRHGGAARAAGDGQRHSIFDYVMQTEVARAVQRHRAAQRQAELLGMVMTPGQATQRVRPGPNRGPDVSR